MWGSGPSRRWRSATCKPEEALPLAERSTTWPSAMATSPISSSTPDGRPYAFNPGSPERVNFGEEKYDKGYYLVTVTDGTYSHEFRPTSPGRCW